MCNHMKMIGRTDPTWKYAKEIKKGMFSVIFMKKIFEGINHLKYHFAKNKGNDVKLC